VGYKPSACVQPSPEVAARIRGNFLDFLERENVQALIPVFRLTFQNFIYGSLEAGVCLTEKYFVDV
jgi:hypothetical protein